MLTAGSAEWKKFFSTNISIKYNVQAGSWLGSLFLSRGRCFRHWRGDREEGENEGWPVGIYDAVQGTSAPHRHCSASTAGARPQLQVECICLTSHYIIFSPPAHST